MQFKVVSKAMQIIISSRGTNQSAFSCFILSTAVSLDELNLNF